MTASGVVEGRMAASAATGEMLHAVGAVADDEG